AWSPRAGTAPSGRRRATRPPGSSARGGSFSTRELATCGIRTVPRRLIPRTRLSARCWGESSGPGSRGSSTNQRPP
ncbi:unnamed protein product, partial [Ectocarpus sp. 13 AM-2016]